MQKSNKCVSHSSIFRDHWEDSRVEVRTSGVGTDSGEGLYLKKDINKGEVIALFNGIRKQFLKVGE